nr:hypothetical protein [Tanacetum cinerariifolium]
MVVFAGENIKALENVIKDESQFFTEVVENHLSALAMIAKYFMSEKRKWIVRPQWRKRWKRWFHGRERRWLVSQMLDRIKRGSWWIGGPW